MSLTPFRFVLTLAALGLLCVGTAQAQQQQQGRRPGGFGGGGGGFQSNPGQDKLQLLVNEAVQKELELADDQKADLKKIAEESATKGRELFSGFTGFRDLSEAEQEKKRAEMTTKREALAKEVMTKVADVLLPHQADRLQEIYVQVRGVSLLADDAEISKKLGITDEQKEKLREIRNQAFAALGGGQGGQRPQGGQGNARPQGGQPGQPGGFDPERMAAMRKDREEKSMAVLTATQKEEYAKMKGEAFAEAANIRLGFGGAGGGPGGGRPGQGGTQGGTRTRPGGNNN